jgi:glycosyltransferase involved in cell wall biosynthesis
LVATRASNLRLIPFLGWPDRLELDVVPLPVGKSLLSGKTMMRIGIDGSSILPRRTGVGHYTLQLLRHLAQIDSRNEYVVLLNSLRHALPDEPWMKQANFTTRHYRFPGPALLLAWRYLDRPPIEQLVGEVDVFHSPATYIPPQQRGARVTTVHDLYFMRDPESCDWLGGQYLRTTLPQRLAQMDRIIAISESTRDDLIEWFNVPPEKIAVIYEGVDSRFVGQVDNLSSSQTDSPRHVGQVGNLSPSQTDSQTGQVNNLSYDRPRHDNSAVRARHGLPDRYILFVGTIEPRKNVERLIEAYSIVRNARPDAPPLVIVGGWGKNARRVDRTTATLGLSESVLFIGYVEHDELPAIYGGADLFVLPSLCEGFGLPVLEAMASGVMVVAGDASSLRELVGRDRGLLVDPMRPSQIATGILRALSDKPLRAACIRRGLDFAREMTWERCARQTLAVYEEAGQAANPSRSRTR